MKRLSMLLIVLLFATIFISADDKGVYIKIERTEKTTIKTRPRTVDFIPFQCFYDKMNNAVYLYSASDVGIVLVEVVNEFTGETENSSFDSSEGQTIVFISGTEGEYTITMTTEYEEVFGGVFTVGYN